MKETQRHLDAFEQYFISKQMGKGVVESIKLLKGEFGVSEKTLYKWKNAFDWDEKEAIRSIEIKKEVEERTNTKIVDNKVLYLGIIHKVLAKFQKKSYPIEVKNVSDLNSLIRTALLLQDEATGIQKVEIKDINTIKQELEEYGDVFELVAINDEVRTDDREASKDY